MSHSNQTPKLAKAALLTALSVLRAQALYLVRLQCALSLKIYSLTEVSKQLMFKVKVLLKCAE